MLHHPCARARGSVEDIFRFFCSMKHGSMGGKTDGSAGITKVSWNLVGVSHQLTRHYTGIAEEDDIDILLIIGTLLKR